MIPFPSPDLSRLHVVHDGRLGARCAALLVRSGAQVTTSAYDAREGDINATAIVVLATDRPRPRVAHALDARAWALGRPWISGTLLAHEMRIGPAVIPGTTPCHACWERRTRSVAEDLDAYDALHARALDNGGGAWFRGELSPIVLQAAAILAANAVQLALFPTRDPARAEGGQDDVRDRRLGAFWEADTVSGALRVRRFARVGTCGRCAPGEHARAAGDSLRRYFDDYPLSRRSHASSRDGRAQ